MARNEEKQLGKLNRLYLQREKEEQAFKNPKRPKLNHLSTVDEIKEWLPSIKRDIDFNLKQSEVTCYSDQKVTEFHNEVAKLQKEYKNFVCKIKQVDSSVRAIPWTKRAYEPQRALNKWIETDWTNSGQHQIPTPLLSVSKEHTDTRIEPPLNHCDDAKQDMPLNFTYSEGCTSRTQEGKDKAQTPKIKEFCSQSITYRKLAKIFDVDASNGQTIISPDYNVDSYQLSDAASHFNDKDNLGLDFKKEIGGDKKWSGLDYSSSSSEES